MENRHTEIRRLLGTILLTLSIALGTFAQEKIKVTGTVTDEAKEPLVGVTITVKDLPGFGTVTNIDGHYEIEVERYQKLVFSYVGFKTKEVLVDKEHRINISLKESEILLQDEVVVTAMGAQKKLTVTGAVASVNVDELKTQPSISIANNLAGRVPGIMGMQTSGQPGRNFSEFWIRGISTFGANKGAYVLVDGFERDINEVNIEDIASFSVLKDASATAIYGSKGANGVILITTKQGHEGRIRIDGKVETTYNMRTFTPSFVDGITYANLLNEARVTRNQEPIYKPEELEILRLGLDPDLYPNVDWKSKLLKDGAMSYRANLNLSGGSEKARYFVSFSYIEDQGMYKTDKELEKDYNTNANYQRYNYRLNTDINITRSTLLALGVSGSLQKRNSPGLGDGFIWDSLFGYSSIRTPILYSNGYVPAIGEGNRTNPWVVSTQTGYNENWQNNIQTNVTLEQDFDQWVKGLKFVGRFGYDTNNTSNIERRKWPEQWRAERARDSEGNIVFINISGPSEMQQSSSSFGDRREFLDLMLNYNGTFNDDHHVGGDLKYTHDSFVYTVNIGDDIKNGIPRRNQSLAGRLTYNWRYRYFIDFNFGYNGSENFATGHRFGFFPAASLAWNIGEEKFITDNVKWINMLKLRGSFGQVGNDNLGNDRFPFLYTLGDNSGYDWAETGNSKHYGGKTYAQVASPFVTWEVATKADVGVDLSILQDRFQLTVDYFDEKREGIYMERRFLPGIVGIEGGNPRANVGAVRSRGIDGFTTYRQRIGEVDLTVRGNMTYSHNTILERDEENNVYSYQMEKGYRVDQTKGLIALGLFKDYEDIRNSPTQEFGYYQPGDIKYKDVNGDGVINNGDRVAVGATRRPNLVYGIGVSTAWHGLDFSVHFQGTGKSNFFIQGKSVWAFSEGEWGNVMKDVVSGNRWIAADISGDPATEDPNASYPRLSFGGNANNFRESTFWLRNGAYLRLKTLDVGYTLPTPIANKLLLSNARFFLVGSNLLTWSPFKLWDPELGNTRGEDYPVTKSVTFGISVNI